MTRAINFLFSFILFHGISFAQVERSPDSVDYYKAAYLRYENFVYKSNIKTVIFERDGFPLSDPVLVLNGGEKLKLSFDDLDADYKNYSYTFEHCDAWWKPSDIIPSEFLEGFSDDRITDYSYSFNTIQRFTHYNLYLPKNQLKPLLSGNYLLKVYLEGNPEDLVITRRFIIVDSKIAIEPDLHRATVIDDRNAKQELDFKLNYPGYVIPNPFADITVILMQNGRWDNAVYGLKPLFVKDHLLEYNYEDNNVFNGGNEFRTFDTRNLRIQTQFVKRIDFDTSGYDVYVTDDVRRSAKRYSTESDINGRMSIKTYNGKNNETDADYSRVHFKLMESEPAKDGNFYIFGELTDWSLSKEGMLKYNYEGNYYETTLYLKQGYYDYEYVFLKDGEHIPDETIIEGNHFETENDYTILVYNRAMGTRYDQLIGYKKINSKFIY